MKVKLITAAIAAVIVSWAPHSLARQSVALPYLFGVAPGDSVGQETGLDTTGAALLTINPDININTLNDVGGGITNDGDNLASILFLGNSTVTGFTGTSSQRFNAITAGANATTVNLNGDVFVTTFNVSGTGTVNFNGNVNSGIVAASTIIANDGFINIGANQQFNSAITTNTANTGTLTFNSGSSVIGAIGGASGLKQINVVGGNAAVTGAVQAREFNLGTNTLNITGALTTNAAGTISTTFASDAVFGKIVATGDSAINSGGVTVITTVTGALTEGTTYRIVESPSGTDAAPVNVINNSPRYTFTGLPTTLGNVDIQLTGIAPLETLVTDPGAVAVAPILDVNAAVGSDLRDIQDAIAVLPTADAINDALAQLAPGNTNLAAPWVTAQTTRLFDDLWMAQVDRIQTICCDTSCDDPNNPDKPLDLNACMDADQEGQWWAEGFGSQGEQGSVNNMNGYDTEAFGLMLAYDKPLSHQTRVGFGGGYATSTIDGDNSSGSTDIDSFQITGYLHHAPGPMFVQAAVTVGVNAYQSDRNIVFPGVNRTAKSDYTGQQYAGIVTVGRHYQVNETIITPLASLQASHVRVGSYTETGADDLNLSIDSQDYNFVQSTLGVKAERVIRSGNRTYAPEVHAKWKHDFNSTTMAQDATFTGGGGSFNAQGIEQDRDLFNVGAGVTFLSCNCEKDAWAVKALYDYNWNDSEYSSHQVSLIASLKF
ncbi:autotransporter family protein [Nitrincola iocasae]|uniref:Autotransporter domain-containing protein n=1 Tax=Nitrincola iocasae TaxID=2614693 RepID=A0A5J6LFQ4_9GAMM|nr:autotransporter outer membrane beta-barrel domain-containing protein [Nitrincola iocasae]QEW07394.1 autotransporter domain-containing protein [Nitrincola iocasae]